MQDLETLQCLPPICEKELPPSELTVHTCITTPFLARHKEGCQSDSDREADMAWPHLPTGQDGHSPATLARAQQTCHKELTTSRQARQLRQPMGPRSPDASSSSTLQNLTSIPEGSPLQDADAVAATCLVQGLQAEAEQYEMVGSPCPAPVPCSKQPQQDQEQQQELAQAACLGPAQAVPVKRGIAISPPASSRASTVLASGKAALSASPSQHAAQPSSTQVWTATVFTLHRLSSEPQPVSDAADHQFSWLSAQLPCAQAMQSTAGHAGSASRCSRAIK